MSAVTMHCRHMRVLRVHIISLCLSYVILRSRARKYHIVHKEFLKHNL